MEPKIIKGAIFSDHRGTLSFVNDFSFPYIQRFYIISNSKDHPLRAWQGHKLNNKYFYCIQGAFRISYFKIDNWELPSKDLEVKSNILKAEDCRFRSNNGK
jgi:dTDP-4-dehydrorhamnose 3,5-epimerase